MSKESMIDTEFSYIIFATLISNGDHDSLYECNILERDKKPQRVNQSIIKAQLSVLR